MQSGTPPERPPPMTADARRAEVRRSTLLFGEFELDLSKYKLRRAGSEIPLQPKVFDAIRYLVERHDRVVHKEELLEALWPGEHVNDTAVPWTISRARKALGQDADANHPIETVRGRGYRFVGEVREGRPSQGPSSHSASADLEAPVARAPVDPFVGRRETIERLMGALEGATRGRGRLCLLVGEAGMGKTRCTNEFARMARIESSVWTGRCLEGGRTAAFWPWVQVLRDASEDETVAAPTRDEIGERLRELSAPSGSGERVADVDASSAVAARFWVLETLSRALLRCSEAGPRVILLEDVHWADEASLDLLIFLAAELSRARLLVVATARDTRGPASEPWTKALQRLGPCDRLGLTGLNLQEVTDYLAEATGLTLSPEIHRAAFAKCGGNPLFLQETARLLAAEAERRGAESLRADDVTVPAVARDLLRARLTNLSPAACEMLEVACVIGQEFDLSVLGSALGIAAAAVLVTLDEASRAHLVSARGRAVTYGFTHELLREALYDELPAGRRLELHERVGRVLEERSGGDLRLNDLAYHYYRALPRVSPALVERCARAAGEAALRGFAYEDAAQFFRWALEAQAFAGDADARSRSTLLLMLATALRLSGRAHEARKSIERAIDLAREHRLADLLWEAARRLRPSYTLALVPDPVALAALEDASRLLSKDQRSLRIRVLSQLACIPPHSLSIPRSQEQSAQAVALAREAGDAVDLVEALKSRLHGLSGPDHIDELLETTGEMLSIDAYRASMYRGAAEWARYLALLHKGDMVAADLALEEFGRINRLFRRQEALWHYERYRAQRLLHAGDFRGAEAALEDLAAQSRRLELPFGQFLCALYALEIAYQRNGAEAVVPFLRQAGAELEWVSLLPSFRAHEIRFLLEIGRVDDARRAFDAMAQSGFEIPKEYSYLNALCQLSLVAVRLEDRPRAEALYGLLQPYPNHNTPTGLVFYQGSVSYFLGRLAQLLGRHDEALAHLEGALAMNARIGFASQLVRTQLALAGLLAEDAGRGSRTRAAELVTEAGVTARRLELSPLLAQVDGFHARMQTYSGARWRTR